MTPRPMPAVIRHDAEANPAETARRLAAMAARLSPDWQRPERWHESKSELCTELRRLAAVLDRQAR